MMKKVPCHAVDASLIMTILPVSQDIVEPEDP